MQLPCAAEVSRETGSNLLKIFFRERVDAAKGPAIFIDRDGVINCRRPDDYVLDWSQFVFVPGIREALKQLSSLGLPMIVISNQAAVGKGLLDPAGLEEITTRMNEALVADGTSLAAAYYCPHRIEDDCPCRKPKPALLFSAAADFNIDLGRSIFIGDSETDVQTAWAARCKPILYCANNCLGRDSSKWMADVSVAPTPGVLFRAAAKCLHNETPVLGCEQAAEKV
jgi:histidinol-phosphate phosphatase family protein